MGSVNGHKGRRYKPRLIRVTFEDGPYEDLEVIMRPASVGDLMDLMAVADLAEDVAEDAAVTAVSEAHVNAINVMVAKVAYLITGWNVDDPVTGEPVAPDEAGVRGQDFAMVFAVFSAYSERLTRVAPPLPGGSSGGPDLADIPVETLSPASQLN